jgi:hypothetical protein
VPQRSRDWVNVSVKLRDMRRLHVFSVCRRWLVGAAVAACVFGGALLLEATIAKGGARHGQTAPTQAPTAPSAALVRALPVFGTPRTPADGLNGRDRGGMAAAFFADQTHLIAKAPPVRGRGQASDTDVFLAGGSNDDVCVLLLPPGADGPGGACSSLDAIDSGRTVVTLERGDAVAIAGLVRAGVPTVTVTMVDGTTTTLPVIANAYSALLPGPTATLSFDGPDGTVTINAASS